MGKNIAHWNIKNEKKKANEKIRGTLTYAAPDLFTQKNVDFFKPDIF